MPMERVRLSPEVAPNLPVRERTERVAARAAGGFRDQLKLARSGQFNQRIEKALAELEELGARLADSRMLADLQRYRQAVGMLVRDVTNQMVQVRTDLDWDTQSWEQRTIVTIQRLDEALEQLANLVLSQEQDRLEILAKMGEIKGLILDMRM